MIKIKGVKSAMAQLNSEFKRQAEQQKIREMDKLVSELKTATPVDTGTAAAGWQRKGNDIVNPVEYIEHLNSGSSQQAPAYFVERTVLAHEGVSPRGIIVKTS